MILARGTRENNRGVYGLGATPDAIYLTYIVTVVPFVGTWSGITAVTPIVES